MIIVLSPAKTLDFVTPPAIATHTLPDFLDQSQRLVDRLRGLSPIELGRLLGVSDRLAALNVVRYAQWARPFTPGNAKQAVLAFNGDVYAGLDAATLDSGDFAFAQRHLRLLSGLYGLLRPLDLILPYRLDMGTRLANPRGSDLYAFWGERIADALNSALADSGAGALVNLASQEYFRSIRIARLSVPVIEPVFEDWSAGQRKFMVQGVHAKRARGLMARFALRERLTDPSGLKDFSAGGYAYVDAASNATRWVFRRGSVEAE